METLNLDAVEQQQIIITVAVNNSDGTPADLTQYACYAASIGQQDPYTRRAPRKEWAAAINNESSAYILTAPGLEMAAAPWRYSIYLKDRKLGLEWVICSGRITLTPRACGTDGISPAAYSISAECTPSGLVNVSLDATVGSISGTLEEVKASAALASTSAANAHADLEDARKAATTAAQAATTAASDAKTAAEAAARAEKAATDAPQACAPFVGQVQAAAVQAQQAATHSEEDANRASTAATTATEKAQVATDAAETATTASSDLASARDTAVQASTTAQAAQQTAQLASTTATTAAENAREYAEDAQRAKQAAATSESNTATAAQHASDSASAAAASAQSAQASAATAVSAKSDLETARDTATAAATTATDAATAAATSETNATSAATAAATAQTAAEAAQAQADTDARAVAILVPRAEAAQQAAADSATAAAARATDAAASATDAAASATAAAESAASIDVFAIAARIAAGTASMEDGIVMTGKKSADSYIINAVKKYQSKNTKCDYLIVHGISSQSIADQSLRICLFSDSEVSLSASANKGAFAKGVDGFAHLPNLKAGWGLFDGNVLKSLTFSPTTTFDKVNEAGCMIRGVHFPINWAPGTTFNSVTYARQMFEGSDISLPDTVTFRSVTNGSIMFLNSGITKLPSAMELLSVTDCTGMFRGCKQMEIEDIVRVCLTINDLQALVTPKTGSLGLPVSCKHNGETIDTRVYLNDNHPDFLLTLNARGWTVTFA